MVVVLHKHEAWGHVFACDWELWVSVVDGRTHRIKKYIPCFLLYSMLPLVNLLFNVLRVFC